MPLQLGGRDPLSLGRRRCRWRSRIAAVALMVMEVLTLSSGISVEQRSPYRARESTATPTLPTSPAPAGRRSRSRSGSGRSKATDKPVCPCASKIAVALVRFSAAGEPGVLAHGPEAAAVHGQLDAAGRSSSAGKSPAGRRSRGRRRPAAWPGAGPPRSRTACGTFLRARRPWARAGSQDRLSIQRSCRPAPDRFAFVRNGVAISDPPART